MLVRLCDGSLRRLLELLARCRRSSFERDVELVVLRHENMVLRRQIGRSAHDDADRAILSALARVLPRDRWRALLVEPDTIVGWHRRLATWKRNRGPRRRRGRPPVDPVVEELVYPTGPGEPLLGLSAHPRRARPSRHPDRRLHGLDDPGSKRPLPCPPQPGLYVAAVPQIPGRRHRRRGLLLRRHHRPPPTVGARVRSPWHPPDPACRRHRPPHRPLRHPIRARAPHGPRRGPHVHTLARPRPWCRLRRAAVRPRRPSCDLHVILTPFRTPVANSICERAIGTIRRECTDRLLVLGQRHLRRVLAEYAEHYNTHRPHRAMDQEPPMGLNPDPTLFDGAVHRRRVVGGLINEHHRAA